MSPSTRVPAVHHGSWLRSMLVAMLVTAMAVTGVTAADAQDPTFEPVPMGDGAGESERRAQEVAGDQESIDDQLVDALTGSDVDGPQGDDNAGPATADVEPSVRQALAEDAEVDVIVRWRERPDHARIEQRARGAAAAAGRDAAQTRGQDGQDVAAAARAARVRTVVEELRATASRGRERVADVLAGPGIRDVTDLWVIGGASATVDADGLEALASDPDVLSVELDETLQLPEPIDEEPPLLPTWSLEAVAATDTWGDLGVDGDGIVVGIMDSGVDGGHPGLADSYRGRDGDHESSWYAATGESYATPGDGHGHGTHVMGSVLGAPPGEVTGVAPGAEWIAAKIFRDSGSTSASIIHASFQWMLAPGGDPADAPHVVNNSWGAADPTITEFLEDVRAWDAAGIVPVFAAGNSGPGSGTVGSPGSFLEALTVGATDVDDVIASFSSRGPVSWEGESHVKPDVSAPGHRVFSAWPTHLADPPYHTISGTSMATPHVSGVAALVLASAPDLDPDQVKALLAGTARVEGHMGSTPNPTYGHGIVDAHAAVLAASRSGVVTGAVTGPDGPVEATVSVLDPDGLEATTGTDPETGAYRLTVREGTRTLEVRARGMEPTTVEVEVVRGETTVRDVTLDPAPESSLRGTVRSDDGGPVAGAAVRAEDHVAWTGEDGTYEIDLPAGRWTVDVRAAGYGPVADSVDVLGDTVHDVTLSALPDGVGDAAWDTHLGDVARSGLSDEVVAPPTLERDWQLDLGGESLFASPTISGGTVYATTTDGRLHAVDLDDGTRKWAYPLSDTARSTPTVEDGTVYVGGGDDGRLHAVDAETGEPRWTYDADDGRTTYATPAVTGDTVMFTTGFGRDDGGTMHAVDVATGAARWVVEIGGNAFVGPTVVDGLAIAGSLDTQTLTAVDVAAGEVAWTHTRPGNETFLGAPSAADGLVHVVASDLDLLTGTIVTLDASTGEVKWEARHGDGQLNTPVISGDVLVAGTHSTGLVAAFDRATGERLWRVSAGPAVTASTAVTADGYVLLGTQLDDEVLAVDVASGEVVWRDQVTDSVLATPAADEGYVVALDSGAVLTAYTPTGTVAGTVTGPDGPVDATIEVVETGASTTSSEDGSWSLAHRPGTWTIRVTAWGHGQQEHEVGLAAGRTSRLDLTLEAVGDGELVGTVTGEDGDPIEGATVTVADTPLDPVTTGDDGTYSFPEVAAGEWTLAVEAAGWVPASQVVVVEEGATTTADVTLSRYDVAIINDFQGLDHDRGQWAIVLEDEGLTVDEVTIEEATAGADEYGAIVANFGTGSSDFPTRAEAEALLDATAAAGTSVIWTDAWGQFWGGVDVLRTHFGDPASTRYDANDGATHMIAHVDHPLTASLTIGERVQVGRSGTGWASYQDFSGRTLATMHSDGSGETGGAIGLRAREMDTADVLLSLGSDAFAEPDEGDYLPIAVDVMLDAIDYARDATFGAVAGAVQGPGGTGLGNAVVTVVGTGEQVEADEDGTYRAVLQPGEQTLRFSAPGHVPAEHEVTVQPGEELDLDVVLEDSGLGELAGVVTSSRGGDPVEGATVTIVGGGPEGDDVVATTDADGAYAVDLPGGTYPVRVAADGHLDTEDEVTITAGESTTLDVSLEPAARVAVVGDYRDQVTTVLADGGVDATAVDGLGDVVLSEVEVVYYNDDSFPLPTVEEFRDFVDAADAAGVSLVLPDGYYSSNGSVRFLRDAYGDPTPGTTFRGEGETRYVPTDADHKLFDGLDDEPVLIRAGGEATTLGDYSGFPLADIATEEGGVRGSGAAWSPRPGGTVHLLLAGMDGSILQQPEDYWTDQAEQLAVNAVQFAAAPRLGDVTGTVLDEAGQPVAADVTVDGTALSASTDGNGDWTLPLPGGTWTLEVTAFGYETQVHDVEVEANGTTRLDATMVPGDVGGVAGTVTSVDDVGVPSPAAGTTAEGTPLPDATVRLLGTPRETTTDEDGAFDLDLVEPGDYRLEVVADDHLRTRVDLTVVAGEVATADVATPTSPQVGVVDDHEGHMAGYLEHWGYDPVDLAFDDLEAVAGLDLVVANFGNYPRLDPTADGLAAFRDAADRAGVDVVWLDAFQRGSLRWLHAYESDPSEWDEDRNDGAVTASVVQGDHPVVAGLPSTFDVVGPDDEYTWFAGADATTLATVQSAEDGGGDLVAVRGRTASAVEVMLGTIAANYYGHPGYGDEPGAMYTAEAEQLLRNALRWAATADSDAGEARVTLEDQDGAPLGGTIEVVETGRTVQARASDGSAVVGRQPGTWTLRGEAFGHDPAEVTVEIAAGQVRDVDIVLVDSGSATVTGRVTDADGLPVTGAEVTVVGTSLGTTSDGDGRYRLEGIPPGGWTLRFAASGHLTRTEDVTVADGDELTLDVTMADATTVAVWGDPYGALEDLLVTDGHEVIDHGTSGSALSGITAELDQYAVVVLNRGTFSTYEDDFRDLVESAEDQGVSVVALGQWGGYAVGELSDLVGDPESVDYGFVPDAITITATASHPLTADLPSGEAVPLVSDPGSNQQYLTYAGYSGDTVATLAADDGTPLGDTVGYRYTSGASVEVLLSSLGVGSYGRPGDEWTEHADQLFLNAIAFAGQASQGGVRGTVTDDAGDPLADVAVTAVEAGRTTTTASDGRYGLDLPDGEHTLTFEVLGHEPAEHAVTITDSEVVELDVTLTPVPRRQLSGVVTSADGDPVAGAHVQVDGPVDAEATTADDGTYLVDGVLPGDHTVTVTAPGHLEATATVTVLEDEDAALDVELTPIDVGVLGDVDDTLADWLRDGEVAAATLVWDNLEDLDDMEVVVVNGPGDADVGADEVAALLEAAEEHEVSLVWLGTWGVADGGLRLLEEHGDREVTVAAQGYGDGDVLLSDPVEHPLTAGLEHGDRVLATDGYWSLMEDWVGHEVAWATVDTDGDGPEPATRGLLAGYDWRSATGVDVVLSVGAVTGASGPDHGWSQATADLVVGAIEWTREAELEVPEAPTLEAPEEPTTADAVEVSGTAEFRSLVEVWRDGEVVATAEPDRDGAWSVTVDLVEGPNGLTATATNPAGTSEASAEVTVIRDTTAPDVDWTSPVDREATVDEVVEVLGTIDDDTEVTLTVDGEPVELVDGSFVTEVDLAVGEQTLTLVATDAMGHETRIERPVLRLDAEVEWHTPPAQGQSARQPVFVMVDGAETDRILAVEQPRVVALDADGEQVAAWPARAQPDDDQFWAMARDLASGEYDLELRGTLEGWQLRLRGGQLTVP